MRVLRLGLGCIGLLTCAACVTSTTNPFLTYAEVFGLAQAATPSSGGVPSGTGAAAFFRADMSLTFENMNPDAMLETSFIAWVELSSIHSADQQDALLAGNYVQLTQQIQIGTAYTLPVGTYVYNGPGTAGATPVRLKAASGSTNQGGTAQVTASSEAFTLITPDKILVFSQPPVSCDSVAFTFTDPITSVILPGPSTGVGGYKTLAQVDVYECFPFRPGLFFKGTGGTLQPNEYSEGDPVVFTFSPTATNGAFAIVTIGATTTTTTP